MTSSLPIEQSAHTWWEARRLRYNIILSVAICSSWALMIGVVEVFPEARRCLEFSGLTAVFQVFLAMLAITAANLFYLLGELVEGIVQKRFVATYRSLAYFAGCIFSVTLPMIAPLIALLQAITGTTLSVECEL